MMTGLVVEQIVNSHSTGMEGGDGTACNIGEGPRAAAMR